MRGANVVAAMPIMPMPVNAHTTCDMRARRISDCATHDRTDRAADDCARASTERTVDQAILRRRRDRSECKTSRQSGRRIYEFHGESFPM